MSWDSKQKVVVLVSGGMVFAQVREGLPRYARRRAKPCPARGGRLVRVRETSTSWPEQGL